MLCFLPPTPAAPRPDPEPGGRPQISETGLIVIILLVVFCALFAPFGW